MIEKRKGGNAKALTPQISHDSNSKDSNYLAQTQRVNKAFFEKPKTMLQVASETGIYRASICRYVGRWKRNDNIAVVRFGVCPISKHSKVQFLTTNPDLYPKQRQLNLFDPTIDVISKKEGVSKWVQKINSHTSKHQ